MVNVRHVRIKFSEITEIPEMLMFHVEDVVKQKLEERHGGLPRRYRHMD